MKVFKRILAQISFFTIIPSVKASLEETAEMSYLSPIIVGIITSLIDYVVIFITYPLLNKYSFLLLIPTVEILRGFHHLDGLLDVGDALMVRDYNKRLKALHDVEVGSGGIGLLIVYLSLFFLAVLSTTSLSYTPLLEAEVESRALGILLLSTMAPMEGSFMGKIFHERLNKRWKIVLLLAQIVSLGNLQTLLTFIILFVLYYYMGIKVLRGVSGDLIGAVITLSFPIFLLVAERSCYPYFISLFSLI